MAHLKDLMKVILEPYPTAFFDLQLYKQRYLPAEPVLFSVDISQL